MSGEWIALLWVLLFIRDVCKSRAHFDCYAIFVLSFSHCDVGLCLVSLAGIYSTIDNIIGILSLESIYNYANIMFFGNICWAERNL